MGKHKKITCHKCGALEWETKISRIFGCSICHGKLSDSEKASIKRAFYETLAERARAARTEKQIAKERDMFNAQRAADTEHEINLRLGSPRAQKMLDLNMMVQRLNIEAEFNAKVDAVMKKHLDALPPKCRCCFAAQPYNAASQFPEVFAPNGDLYVYCSLCEYGVSRTGYCTAHKQVHFPEVAIDIEPIPMRSYPPALISGLDLTLFD